MDREVVCRSKVSVAILFSLLLFFMTAWLAYIRTAFSLSLFLSNLNHILPSRDLSDFWPQPKVSNAFDIHDLVHVWVYVSLCINEKSVRKQFSPLLYVMDFDIFYSYSLKINPLSWFHGPLVGYHLQCEKQSIVLCMAEEIVGVDGKKRHFGLIRSNLPFCLYRRGEIMVLFRMNFQLFCTRFHSLIWYAFEFC